MIIYQLHEHSGEYDYYCDRIIGSYLRKDCQNYYVTWDEATFSIEEVEVEGLNGEWFIDEFPNQNKKFLICSECRAVIDCSVCQIDENEFDFCPYCGADMRKDNNNGE